MSWWEGLSRTAFWQRVPEETTRMASETKIGVVTHDLHLRSDHLHRVRKGPAALARFNRYQRWGRVPR